MGKEKIIIKYIVFEDESHEYNLTVTKTNDKTIFDLYYSNNENWTESYRNSLAFSITDTGNEFILPKSMRKLNYSESSYIRLILSFDKIISNNPANVNSQYKIIKVSDEIII